MAELRQELAGRIESWRERNRKLVKLHGREVVAKVTVADLFRGMRGVPAVVCDTSSVDPQKGLFIRDIPVGDLLDCSGESLFYLLCTGRMPEETDEEQLREELASRRTLDDAVWEVIEAMPGDLHPMAMVSAAVLTMQRHSCFQEAYASGVPRAEYWKSTLEDALTLLAQLPVIAAGIYRRKLRGRSRIEPAEALGFSANFAHMLGLADPAGNFDAFIRRFVVVHSDHEGANASVLSARVTGSALTDVFLSESSAMNCLAGHLHGRANQESLRFVLEIERRFDGVPTETQLSTYIRQLLDNGRIIPGFGHAVLRGPDPRYRALAEFGYRLCPDCSVFAISRLLDTVVTCELKARGKVSNPYANVDGISGALLHWFGMTEIAFYTVMFSVAQALGLCAQLVLERALLAPLFRPGSVTTQALQERR